MPSKIVCLRDVKLNDAFDFVNDAVVDAIPLQVFPILDYIVQMVQAVYSPEMDGSLYFYGSAVNGTFEDRVSDIDAVWISNKALDDDHPNRRSAWFDLNKCPNKNLITKLDVIAMEISDIANPIRATTNFSCYYNGLQYAGSKNATFTPYIPLTKGDYLMRTYRFKSLIKAFSAQRQDQGTEWLKRNFIKTTARSWYMKAYAEGCRYRQSFREMAAVMDEHGYFPELKKFKRLASLYSSEIINESEKDRVFKEATILADYFESLLKEYNSPYAKWVRSGDY